MKTHIQIFFISIFMGIGCSIFSQNKLDEGWKYFANNDFEASKAAFSEALSGPNGASAHLALSLLGAAESIPDSEEPFDHFFQFYKKSDNPLPYIQGLWSLNNGKRTDDEVKFLEKVAEKEKGTLRVLAQQALGSHHRFSQRHNQSVKAYKRVGAISEWAVLGEFENISESGFDKDFGGLAHPERDYPFTNKLGVEVNWFDIKAPRYDNWVDMAYYFYAKDAIIYAQNFCKSSIEQEVQFRLGVSGSVKVWLNDQLLFQEEEERNNNIDSYIFTAKLLKGYNRILIQLGESEVGQCKFILRITDQEGENIEGLEYTTDLQSYNANYQYKSSIIEDKLINFFKQKIDDKPGQIENYLILSQYYTSNDDLFEAKKIMKAAKERFPDCSYLLFQLITAYAKDNNRTLTTELIEELKLKAPDNLLVLNLLYDEAESIEDLDEQEALLSKIEAKEGNSSNVYAKKIAMAYAKEEREKMLDIIREAYDAYPDEYDFVSMMYEIAKEVESKNKKAVSILEKYLSTNYSEDAIIKLAANQFDMGRADEGVLTYQKLVRNNEIASGYYSQLAAIFYNFGRYKQSNTYVKECLRIAPYVGSYHETLGNTYAQLEQKTEAIKTYEKAIRYDPYNYNARRQLRLLQNKEDIFDSFPEIDVYELYENAPDASQYPDDHSVVLANNTYRMIYPGGASEEEHTVLVKVFNTSGVDYWKEYQISVYNNQDGHIEKAEVLKANGGRVRAERDGGYIVFSNLEPGDAIHLTYRLQNYFSGKLSNHFWGTHYFESFLPMTHSCLSLIVPNDTEFQYHCENSTLEPTIKELDDFKRYTWESKNQPAVKEEPFMSSLSDIATVVHYSSFPDWDYISDWYADLAQAKSKINFEVEETARALFMGKENASDQEKVKIIYNYIVDNIRYRSVSFLQSGLIPQKASTTLSAKQGDCKDVSTLFVALCKTQGIDANLVLINTRWQGYKRMMLPSINFNHCIAKVTLDDSPHYLELTMENLPFGAGGVGNKQVFSLEIPKDKNAHSKASILNTGHYLKNSVERKTSVTFDGDNMIVQKENTKEGEGAAGMRNTYEKVGKKQQLKSMQEAINREYPGIELQELEFYDGLENNAPTVNYMYKFMAPNVFTDISNLRIFKIPLADDINNPDFLSTKTRAFPLELWQYFGWEIEKENITISLPEGYTVAEIPAPVVIETSNISYSMTYELQEDQLIVIRYFELLDDIVQPEDYQTFKIAVEKMVKADKGDIALKKV